MHRVAVFAGSFLALFAGSALLSQNDVIYTEANASVPSNDRPVIGKFQGVGFTKKLDQVEPGYHDVTGFMFDGISESKLNPDKLRPTFSFSIDRVAYGNVEPIGVMPVAGDAKPRVLVQRRGDGHNSVIIVISASDPSLKEIRETAPEYILSGKEAR